MPPRAGKFRHGFVILPAILSAVASAKVEASGDGGSGFVIHSSFGFRISSFPPIPPLRSLRPLR